MPVRRDARCRVSVRVVVVKPIAVGVGIGLVIAVLVSEMFRHGWGPIESLIDCDTIHYF